MAKQYVNLTSEFPPDKFNLLYPSETVMEISPLQKVSFEQIHISPTPIDGEVYKVGNVKGDDDKWVNKFALAKSALEKICFAAGIIFDPNLTGKVPNSNPRIYEYRVRGALQKPDGNYVDKTMSVQVELDIIEEKLRLDLEEKARTGKLGEWVNKSFKAYQYGSPECTAEIERQYRKLAIQAREFAGRKAESGAHNRVIRSLLGLKPSYTEAELKKPFVVVKVSLNVETLLADPTTKQQIINAALNAQSSVFGLQPKRIELALPAPSVVEQSTVKENITEEAAHEVVNEPEAILSHNGGKDTLVEEEQTPEQKYKADWLKCSAVDRKEEIERLLKAKGQKFPDGMKWEDLPTERQVGALWYYRQMSDLKPVKDDLPF